MQLDDYGFKPFQRDVAVAVEKALQRSPRGLAVLPVYCGEDLVAAALGIETAKRALYICVNDSMHERVMMALGEHAQESAIGEATGRKFDVRRRTLIGATIKTLQARMESGDIDRLFEDGPFDLIVILQAHLAVAPGYQPVLDEVVKRSGSARILGVTPTPFREDGVSLKEFFREIITTVTLDALVAGGDLVPFRVEPHTDVKRTPEELAALWIRRADRSRGVIFCATINESRMLCNALIRSGVKAVHVDSKMKADELGKALQLFAIGMARVICNVGLMNDSPVLRESENIMFVRNVDSSALFMQIIGLAMHHPSARRKEFVRVIDVGGGAARQDVKQLAQKFNADGIHPKKHTPPAAKEQGEHEEKRRVELIELEDAKEYFGKIATRIGGRYVIQLGPKKGFVIAQRKEQGYRVGVGGYEKIYWRSDVENYAEMASRILELWMEKKSEETGDLISMSSFRASPNQMKWINAMVKAGLFGSYVPENRVTRLEASNLLAYGFFKARKDDVEITPEESAGGGKRKSVVLEEDGTIKGADGFDAMMRSFVKGDVYVVSKKHYALLNSIARSVKQMDEVALTHVGDDCTINGFKFHCDEYKSDAVIKAAVGFCMQWNERMGGIG